MGLSIISSLEEIKKEEESEQFHSLMLVSSQEFDAEKLNEITKKIININKKSKQTYKAFDINFVQDNKNICGYIESIERIKILKINKNLYLVLYPNLGYGSNRRIKKLFFKIPWLTTSWLKPEYMDKIYKEGIYSGDFDDISIDKEYDPYYIRKKHSYVPTDYDNQVRWFRPRGIKVSIRGPKIDIPEIISDHLKSDISETIQTRFTIHYNNPGDATLNVDENTYVVHRSGEQLATQKFINDVVDEFERDIKSYEELVPLRKYKKLIDGSYDLVEFSPSKLIHFTLSPPRTISLSAELSFKLENLLGFGDSTLPFSTHGFTIKREKLEFMSRIYLPLDCSEYIMHFSFKEQYPTLDVLPINTTPIGLLTLQRIIAKRIDRKVKISCEN